MRAVRFVPLYTAVRFAIGAWEVPILIVDIGWRGSRVLGVGERMEVFGVGMREVEAKFGELAGCKGCVGDVAGRACIGVKGVVREAVWGERKLCGGARTGAVGVLFGQNGRYLRVEGLLLLLLNSCCKCN